MAREYKDSGIAWIGQIPKEWEVIPLKWVIRAPLQYGANESGLLYKVDLPRYVRITDIINNNLREDIQKQSLTEEQAEGYILEDKDILFARSGATVGKAFIYKNKYGRCAYAGYLIRAQLSSNYCPEFVYYYTQSHAYEEWKKQIFIQATIQNIGADRYSMLEISFPSFYEQQKIADFLDKVCGEVDEMVALQETMIEELKAYKQSVITEAVTKGLNPRSASPLGSSKNVPMRDSGIDWIGEIPKHWGMQKMNRICSVITDFVASGSFESLRQNVPYLDEPDYAMLVRTADLSGSARTSGKVYISKHSYEFLRNSNLYGGEIVLPNIGASVGDVYIVPNLYEHMSLAPNSIMFKTVFCDKYYYYYYYSKAGKESIFDINKSTAQGKFNKTELRNVIVCVPPLSEQLQIASYLDTKCSEIDSLIALKQAKIEELKEYKKSVIYEYVTGKKEVV